MLAHVQTQRIKRRCNPVDSNIRLHPGPALRRGVNNRIADVPLHDPGVPDQPRPLPGWIRLADIVTATEPAPFFFMPVPDVAILRSLTAPGPALIPGLSIAGCEPEAPSAAQILFNALPPGEHLLHRPKKPNAPSSPGVHGLSDPDGPAGLAGSITETVLLLRQHVACWHATDEGISPPRKGLAEGAALRILLAQDTFDPRVEEETLAQPQRLQQYVVWQDCIRLVGRVHKIDHPVVAECLSHRKMSPKCPAHITSHETRREVHVRNNAAKKPLVESKTQWRRLFLLRTGANRR
mmetsp:Transcript_51894/g.137205  ORF Transcript_51894/g.137205 Transcript_51894/m.137205 type:complete len:294 (-) Transcript_51894:693-1574(-)